MNAPLPPVATQPVDNAGFLRAIRGELAEGEHMWVAGFADDPAKATGTCWHGRQVLPGTRLEAATNPAHNNYFAVSALIGGKRRAENFSRLMVLVADDADRTQLTREPSWVLRTSVNKAQIGFILRDDDPTTRDKAACIRAVAALAPQGQVKADKSGNSTIRYVRLPVGTNTKASYPAPFAHELVEWRPDVRVTLAEALEAFGVSPEAVAPAAPVEPTGEPIPPPAGRFPLGLLANALSALDPSMGRDPWLRIGMALHFETEGAAEGLDAWDAWSADSLTNYTGRDPLESAWASFGKAGHDRSITGGTILKMARDTGWTEPAEWIAADFDALPSPSPEEAAESEAARQRNAEKASSQTYAGGRFKHAAGGVFFIGTDKDGEELPPLWLCPRLDVLAMTRDAKSGEWGRLLGWQDADGVAHRWAMPMDLLQGDGSDVRRELARLGLNIAPGKRARELLMAYLQVWPVQARARCVDRLGWHGGVFVTPAESIGQAGELVVFQNAHAIEPAFSEAGTTEAWRDSVAAMSAGNSRLVFAICAGLAGPLAELAGEDSGGFHLRGASSSGKTTALKVAASVWGDPSAYPRLWRATANGLEGLAALHNDGLLILDELSQIDPREAGEAAYLLANGQGKARASRTGTARQSARWRVLFLSAGEESLTALMARAGRKANAGQEIRLADIEADAGAGMGAFEALHDQATPAALALAVKDAAARCHGAVGVTWLRSIVRDRAELAGTLPGVLRQFVADAVPAEAAGQVERVARRFALLAAAGELATGYGLTGWPVGEASRGVRACFDAWLAGFGGSGNREDRSMLAQVRAFFEAHGASRFQPWDDLDSINYEPRTLNRAGFVRVREDGARDFFVLPEAYRREVCTGFDEKAVTRALLAAGWLVQAKDRRFTHKARLPGMGSTRCYLFGPTMWSDDNDLTKE